MLVAMIMNGAGLFCPHLMQEGLTNLKFLISGITTTIYISTISIVIAMFVGLLIAIPAITKNKYLTYINIFYVEVVRSVPLLVLILWVYYGLPILTGLSFSPFVSGIIALSISESAFMAEIFRGGINAIKKTQWEAATSLGLNFSKKLSKLSNSFTSIQSNFARTRKSIYLCFKNVFFSINYWNFRFNKKSE